MSVTICFANNKGGVGKTTAVAAIGRAWAKMGKKVLFVDLDSQANLTAMISPIEPDQHKATIRDALLNPENLVIEKIDENCGLIPSELLLANFDRDTAIITGREYLLADLLLKVKNDYDFIVIDCPPALSSITYNALIASDHLVMVTTADGMSYGGMVMTAQIFNDVRSNARLNKDLQLSGVIVSRYEKNKLSDMYLQKIKDELGTAFLEPPIPKATKIAQAGSFHQNIFNFDPDGKASQAYFQLAQNLAARIL